MTPDTAPSRSGPEPNPLMQIGAGAFAGLDMIGRTASLLTLVLAGGLAAGVGMTLSIALFATALANLWLIARRALPGGMVAVQDIPLIILLPVLAGLAAIDSLSPEQAITAALMVMGATAITVAVLMALVSRLGAAGLIRLLPYPVLAGFLGGSGLIMLTSSLGRAAGTPFWQIISGTPPTTLLALTLAVIVAGTMITAQRMNRFALSAAVPVVTLLVFYGVILLVGTHPGAMRDAGLLPAMARSDFGLTDLALPPLAGLPLVEIGKAIVTASFVALLALVLNIATVETLTERDVDLTGAFDRTAEANAVLGLAGTAPVFLSGAATILLDQLNTRTVLARGAAVAVVALAAGFAVQLAGLIPGFVLAGVVMALGFRLALAWVIDSRPLLPTSDWLIVLAIAATALIIGMFQAVLLGLGVTVALFVWRYGRQTVFRHQSDGTAMRSALDRAESTARLLDAEGARTQVLMLRGYLFFGSVDQITSAVRDRLAQAPLSVILDTGAVTGLDPSATAALRKVQVLAAQSGTNVILSSLTPRLRKALLRAGLSLDREGGLATAPTLDAALELAENAILKAAPAQAAEPELRDALLPLTGDAETLDRLLARTTARHLEAGETLIEAGSTSTEIFLIARGRLSARVTDTQGGWIRLRAMGPGAVLGEIAAYTGTPRTARVVADTRATVQVLDPETLADLTREDPALAGFAHRLMAAALAEKLTRTSRALADLQRRDAPATQDPEVDR